MRANAFGLIAAAALAALKPSAAAAADLAQIACPVEGLTAAERDRLTDHVRRHGAPEEEAMQRFFRGISECAQRHGWSDGAARQAIVHSLASIGQREARATLESSGIDVAAIERALLADRAVVASARTDGAAEQIGAFFERLDPRLRERVAAAGEPMEELLGSYLLYRAAVETSRVDFAAQ